MNELVNKLKKNSLQLPVQIEIDVAIMLQFAQFTGTRMIDVDKFSVATS